MWEGVTWSGTICDRRPNAAAGTPLPASATAEDPTSLRGGCGEAPAAVYSTQCPGHAHRRVLRPVGAGIDEVVDTRVADDGLFRHDSHLDPLDSYTDTLCVGETTLEGTPLFREEAT